MSTYSCEGFFCKDTHERCTVQSCTLALVCHSWVLLLTCTSISKSRQRQGVSVGLSQCGTKCNVPHRASIPQQRHRILSCITPRVCKNSWCHPASSGTPESDEMDKWGGEWSDGPHWSDIRLCWRRLVDVAMKSPQQEVTNLNTHSLSFTLRVHVTADLHKHRS